jgi:DNA-binding transcriptional ArsR family regulator
MKVMTIEKLSTAKPYSLFFQALANPTRMQIVNLLRERGKLNVSEISENLELEQTQVSHALKCLTFCGLVTSVREGKSRIYSVNEDTIRPMLKIVEKHIAKYATNLYNCDVLER